MLNPFEINIMSEMRLDRQTLEDGDLPVYRGKALCPLTEPFLQTITRRRIEFNQRQKLACL
jgi:hypothetical protein